MVISKMVQACRTGTGRQMQAKRCRC